MIASTAATQLPLTDSAAARSAERNWAANLTTVTPYQPNVASIARAPEEVVEWLFGRDGALTAMLPDERWWAGCSLPLAAARFMLRKMEAGGNVSCFLSPRHAAQLRVGLDRLERNQAIIAIVPDSTALWVILHCDDFSVEIASHRLWFAAGENWQSELERLFVENPGLATPTQFIRPILADSEPTDRLIGPAQQIFVSAGSRRAETIRQLASASRNRGAGRRVCLVAPSHFRLWDPAAQTLARVVEGQRAVGTVRIDSDDPASTSPLALASAIVDCDAIVAANFARSDAPDVALRETPWVTWVTKPQMPDAEPAGPNDHLLLADLQWRAPARARGWPDERIHVAGWPRLTRGEARGDGTLVLVADTEPLQPPKKVEDFSSHKLLWEMIADELLNDPLAIGEDVEKYLSRRMSRLQIAEGGFDRSLFVDRLIVPALGQGFARLLTRTAIPLKLHGKGWEQIEGLSSNACGPVLSAAEFDEILEGAAALVHPWPWNHAHPIDAVGRPVLRAFGQDRETFLRNARIAVKQNGTGGEAIRSTPISWDVIASLFD